MSKVALLLVGSPKAKRSTSEVLGGYVLDELQKNGFKTEKENVHRLLKADNGSEKLIKLVNTCDILIFSSPLYIDSIPAPVVRAMEIIAESKREQNQSNKQLMLAITNCGFPEASHNHLALDIYKHFAKEAGFEWVGGLALGGGGTIGGQPLTKFGRMTKNIIKSLDLTTFALLNGNMIPEEAIKLMEKPMVPNWLYILVGHHGWRTAAKKYGVHQKLNNQPYK